MDVDLDTLIQHAVKVEAEREASGEDDVEWLELERLASTCTPLDIEPIPQHTEFIPVHQAVESPQASKPAPIASPFLLPSKQAVTTFASSEGSNPRKKTSHDKKMKTNARAASRRAQKGKAVYSYRVASPTRKRLSKPRKFHFSADAGNLSAATGGWVGKNIGKDNNLSPPNRKKPYTLEECAALEFRLIKWDGMCAFLLIFSQRVAYVLFSTPHVLLDKLKRIIAVLAGRPHGDSSWDTMTHDATNAMEEARARCSFSDGDTRHLRGEFPTLKVGAAHGGGTPVRLKTFL